MPRPPKPPKPPAPTASPFPKPRTRGPENTAPKRSGAAEGRWQRTVRYGWDKGGAKGGR